MKAIQLVLLHSILSLLICSPSVAGDFYDQQIAKAQNESNEKMVMMVVGGGVVAAALIAGAIFLKKKK